MHPFAFPIQGLWLRSETPGFSPVWCLSIHLLYMQAASYFTLPTTEGKHLVHLEQWDDKCLSLFPMKPAHAAVVEEITWLTSPSLKMNTTWNSDQQTFLNPNTAPLCQLYASLLQDFAELLSIWRCHCFITSHSDFSLVPKPLRKLR